MVSVRRIGKGLFETALLFLRRASALPCLSFRDCSTAWEHRVQSGCIAGSVRQVRLSCKGVNDFDLDRRDTVDRRIESGLSF